MDLNVQPPYYLPEGFWLGYAYWGGMCEENDT